MSEPVELCLEYIHETDNAVLFHDGDGNVWIPKSLLQECEPETHNLARGDAVTVSVPKWFAKQNALI